MSTLVQEESTLLFVFLVFAPTYPRPVNLDPLISNGTEIRSEFSLPEKLPSEDDPRCKDSSEDSDEAVL